MCCFSVFVCILSVSLLMLKQINVIKASQCFNVTLHINLRFEKDFKHQRARQARIAETLESLMLCLACDLMDDSTNTNQLLC